MHRKLLLLQKHVKKKIVISTEEGGFVQFNQVGIPEAERSGYICIWWDRMHQPHLGVIVHSYLKRASPPRMTYTSAEPPDMEVLYLSLHTRFLFVHS